MLDRVYDVGWKSIDKLKNTIEPFASYYYVPNIYQGNMPMFDSFDRLNSRSLVTYGFTTRLFARSKQEAPDQTTADDHRGLESDRRTVRRRFGHRAVSRGTRSRMCSSRTREISSATACIPSKSPR